MLDQIEGYWTRPQKKQAIIGSPKMYTLQDEIRLTKECTLRASYFMSYIVLLESLRTYKTQLTSQKEGRQSFNHEQKGHRSLWGITPIRVIRSPKKLSFYGAISLDYKSFIILVPIDIPRVCRFQYLSTRETAIKTSGSSGMLSHCGWYEWLYFYNFENFCKGGMLFF